MLTATESPLKRLLRLMVPPIIPAVARRLRLASIGRPLFFETYALAKQACPSQAYEDQDVVDIVVEKNRIFRETMLAGAPLPPEAWRTLLGMALAMGQQHLRVLDFGGGAGFHYQIAKRLTLAPDINWSVVETPTMAKGAQALADGRLQFYDSISAATTDRTDIDLVIASSSLQYCPDPLAYLGELMEVGAKYLYVTRTPMSDAGQRISIQTSRLVDNGPGAAPIEFQDREISYPITFCNRSDFEAVLAKKYNVLFSMLEMPNAHTIGGMSFDLHGYFCQLR